MRVRKIGETSVSCVFSDDELYDNYGIDMSLPKEKITHKLREVASKIACDAFKKVDVNFDEGFCSIEINILKNGEYEFIIQAMPSRNGLSNMLMDGLMKKLSGLNAYNHEYDDADDNFDFDDLYDEADYDEEEEELREEFNSVLSALEELFGEKKKHRAEPKEFKKDANTYIYKFDTLEDTIKFSGAISLKKVESTLYRDDGFYIVVQKEDDNVIDRLANEYMANISNVSKCYLEEHAQKIIKDFAIDVLHSM